MILIDNVWRLILKLLFAEKLLLMTQMMKILYQGLGKVFYQTITFLYIACKCYKDPFVLQFVLVC